MLALQVGALGSVLAFVVVPAVALGAAIALSVYEVYRIGERKLLIVIAILALMLQHQVLEAYAFLQTGAAVAEGIGEVFETGANLIAAGSVYYVLRFARRERRLLRELERSERQYRDLIEESPVPILLHGGDGIQYANDAAVEMLDAEERSAITGPDLSEFLVGDRSQDVRETVLTDGGSDVTEGQLRTLDDETRYAVLSGAPADYEGQDVRQIVVQDRTERRRREREYERIFNSVNDAIAVFHPETGEILDVNETYHEMFGYDDLETIRELGIEGLSVTDAGYTGDRGRQLIREVSETGEARTVEWQAERKNGDRVWLEVTLSTAEIGGETRVLSIQRDATERKRRERIVRSLHESTDEFQEAETATDVCETVVDIARDVLNLPTPTCWLHETDTTEVLTPVATTDTAEHLPAGTEEPATFEPGDVAFDVYRRGETDVHDPGTDGNETPFGRVVFIPLGEHGLFGAGRPGSDSGGDVTLDAARILARHAAAALDRVERSRELRESERRFRLIAEHIDEIIYLARADFSEILYINSVYEDIYGQPVTDLAENPQGFLEAAHPDDRDRYEEDLRRMIAEIESGDPQDAYEGEYRIERDGDVRWVTVTRFPVENEDGTVDRIVGRVQDITRQRELERTYRELFENVSDGLVVHEPDTGEILDVNERFCEMNGYEREDLIGETIGLISPDDEAYSYERAREKIKRARDEGPQLFEWRNERSDGETFPVEVHLTFAELRGEERVIASVRDISERKETEARFQTIVERIDAGVMLVPEGESEPAYLNPVYEEITGMPLEDLYDPETFIEHIHPEDRDGYITDVGAMVDDILAGDPDDRYEFEFRFERPDGETRWLHWTGYPLLEEDNDYWYVGLTTDVTERRERQQRVRENERTYRELFNKTSAAITIHDPETKEMVGVNDTMCELLGYDRETILERDVDGVSVTEEGYSMDRGADIIDRVMESGEPEEYEWLIEDAGGERHWMLVTGSPVTINGERRFLATSQDITERKRRAREYEQIFDGVNDAIAVHDPETGEMLAVNDRLCEITGYDRDALAAIGARGLTVATEEFPPERVPEIIDRVMDGDDVEPYEQAIETRDGERRWLEVNPTRAVIDGEERFLAISRDVTERRERQQRLETERDRRAKLFENTPDPIMAVEFEDGRPHITEVNPSFEETFGFDAQSVADRPIAEAIVPEEEREGYEAIREQALSGDPVETEVRRETARGVRDFLLRVLPFESGGNRHAYVWYTDITERKRREQRLEVFNRVLRHNLRNQLDVIKSHAEALADSSAGDHADRIIVSADRLAAIGRRARTIDRFLSGDLTESTVDLAGLVVDLTETLDDPSRGVAATVETPETAPLVTDDEAVEAVLESALDNAFEYADSTVTVTVEASSDGYTVTIDDDGPGIPADELAPLDAGTESSLQHGRGLGLWQLKWGIDRLGGDLAFDTNHGTTVRITLPDLGTESED